LLDKSQDEKNYFLAVAPEGQDFYNFSDSSHVIGIGNGFISSYSAEAAVGGIPTASVTVEALNVKFDAESTGQYIPAVKPVDGSAITDWTYSLPVGESGVAGAVAALRPGDIEMTLGNAAIGIVLS